MAIFYEYSNSCGAGRANKPLERTPLRGAMRPAPAQGDAQLDSLGRTGQRLCHLIADTKISAFSPMSETEFKSYSERIGWTPAFEVHYRFLAEDEGGRKSPPRQHIRWDFMYEGDDPFEDGLSMVWPEFLSSEGAVLPEGEVPMSGRAHMYIVRPERASFHKERVKVGARGFFMEGSRKVAKCEVTSVLGLAAPSAA